MTTIARSGSRNTTSPPSGFGSEIAQAHDEPRRSMERLPKWFQPLLTWLTGKPTASEASWRLKPWHHLASAVVALLVGLAGSSAVFVAGGRWSLLILPAWLLTVHGARKLRTIIMHQCSHSNFLRSKKWDRVTGKVISILLMTEEFDGYKRAHIADHHSARHQTIHDPTVIFLLQELGLRPGMSPSKMWRRLWWTIISPRYHARFLRARVRSHFDRTSIRHRIIFMAWLTIVFFAVVSTKTTETFLVVCVVPLVLLYQVSSAFRLSSKHVFPTKLPSRRTRESLGLFTHGIFIGESCPSTDLRWWGSLVAWHRWWTRMLFYHLPCRLFVLVGDGPAHDLHHRFPNHPGWSNYIHVREEDACKARSTSQPYQEVWGLAAAIDACFRSLSAAEPADYPFTPRSTGMVLVTADD